MPANPPRAVVVGSLVTDLTFRIPKRPEPGEVIIAVEHGLYRGGKGYNQAVALARLGAQVRMIGAVGEDPYGEGFLSALAREGVDASGVVRLPDTATAVAVPLITPDGDVAFVQYPGANLELGPAHCVGLDDCDLLLLQGEIPAQTSLEAARIVGGRSAIVCLNPAPVHDIPSGLMDLATVVVPNEVEAHALLGAAGRTDIDAAEALRTPTRAAVVTLGARGAAWADSSGSGLVAPPSIEAVDATAAGDSFCAALALRLAEGAPLSDAVRFACAAGAHAATVAGAEPSLPTRADVERLLT